MHRREGLVSLGARLRQTAGQLGDAIAVRSISSIDQYREMSWSELDRKSEQLACHLLRMDVAQRPATVVLITRDAVQHAIYAYGAWKAGQTILCLSPGLGSSEGGVILSRLGRTISFGVERAWDRSEHVQDADWQRDWSPLLDRVANPMLLITTGGSTGIPKLVDVIGAGEFVPGDFLGGLGAALKRRPRSKAFIMTPLSHGAGAATAYMATFEECETTSLEKFDPQTALWAIERFALEQITLVPTMMHRMLRSPRFDPDRLRSIRSLCHTGMQCDPKDKEAWMNAIGPDKVVEVWGSTESVGHAVIAGDEWLQHRGSVGRSVNARIRIVSPEGQDLPIGEVGEIFVQPLAGTVNPDTKYFGSKQRMKSNNGYVSFGDLGRVDADGYLYIAGRTDDLIITGGANVYPDELEVLIRRIPGVKDCVVVARPHADLGHSVHAVISMENGARPLSLEELRGNLKGKLSAYKLPRSVEFVTEITRSDAGKVRRKSYREVKQDAEALTVGNLGPADDFMHSVSAHPSHNESMFFNFFDARQQLGGFVRIGNRPNERHAEMTFCLFLPGGEVLMQWSKPSIESNAQFDAAGLQFRVVEPGRKLHVSYDGPAVRISNPDEMEDPGRAMRGNPGCTAHLVLDVTASGPMIGDREGHAGSVIFLEGVGHYQQPIRATGELVAGSDRWQLDARGVRDHSWGPRIWHSIYRDRSLWISYGPELSIIACKTWLSSTGAADEMGCIVENGRVTPLRSMTMRSHFRAGTFYHDEVRLDLTDTGGRSMTLDGKVLTYVPLRHRKEGQETVYLGQAMTLFTCAGRRAIGLSEYFDAASATAALTELSQRGEYVSE